MAHDAQVPSLSEHSPSLERQVRDLQAILPHLAQTALKAERELAEFKQEAEGRRAAYRETVGRLLARIGEIGGEVEANRARIGVCLANSASATARAELAIEEARKVARDELLAIAEAAGEEDDPPRHAGDRRKRDRHGLHVVRDVAGGTAAVAALFSFLRSPWARGAHRAVAVAAMAALGGAATVAGPSLLMPSPSPAPAATAPAHHQPRRPSMLGADPPPAAHRAGRHHQGAASPSPSPAASPGASPGASPQPSPASTIPLPVPSPTVPVPLPVPTPTIIPPCHGKHCHDPGGGLAQVLSGLLPRWDH